MPDLSEWFNNPTHSDVELSFVRRSGAGAGDDEPSGGESEPKRAKIVDRTFFLLSIVLKDCDMFRSQLDRWVETDANSCCYGNGNKAQISIELTEEEMDAGEAMLRMLYRGAASGESGSMLLRMLNFAEYVSAHDKHTDVIAEELSRAECVIGENDVHMLFRSQSKKLDGLRRKCIQSIFGDVTKLICGAHKNLKAAFRKLPCDAITMWLELDDLTVVSSENCVVTALSLWIMGREVPQETLEKFAHRIRVRHLSDSFRDTVLPHIPWFKSCKASYLLPLVTLSHEDEQNESYSEIVPRAWLAAKRHTLRAPIPVERDFTREEFDAMKVRLLPLAGGVTGFLFIK
jgi:hypothetical protein